MNYATLIKIINKLIDLANKIRLLKCSNNGECLCTFCTKTDCKYNNSNIKPLL